MSDLTAGIRRAAAPERTKGAIVPSTAGSNGGDPVLQAPTPSKTVGGSAAAFPKAEAAHKSMGWHELTDVEVRAYTETMVNLELSNGESLTLDPTRVQVTRVEVSGETTIIVPKPEFPAAATPRQDSANRHRTWSCVLIVFVPLGGEFPTISGVKFAEGQTAPNLKKPDGTDSADYAGTYVMTFVFDPIAHQVYGFESGMRF
ncbi:hypothetical protein GHL01_00345 [Sinorhizobium meliloti]|uniref:hypothetical protein n=1 Tax=Rhizobium meliloti TaxID=382 RepID=UPI00129522B5|nr:hypothetical protein [Sinorhizobium meliloti]MQV12194.1 hypothetical protein [Sinorhizobium meliloti]